MANFVSLNLKYAYRPFVEFLPGAAFRTVYATTIIVFFVLMEVAEPGGSLEDANGVIKKEILRMTFSEWFGTTLEFAIRDPQLRFTIFDPDPSFL